MQEKTEELVRRIRVALKPWGPDITEKRMFGGYCFLYKGKMCVGETMQRLMVRLVDQHVAGVMKEEHVSPMAFTGKPMKEFVFVSEGGYSTEEKLQRWVKYGIEHAKSKTEG